MARILASFLFLIGLALSQICRAEGTVFALVSPKSGSITLEEWETDSLKTLKSWPLDSAFVKFGDQSVYVDAKERKAVIMVTKDKEPYLLILDLRSGHQQLAPDLKPWSPVTYRLVNRQLEALEAVPILEGSPAFWRVWRLNGENWVEVTQLRTKSLDELVRGHKWLNMATQALEIVEPTGRLFSFGVCGNGPGLLPQKSTFGGGTVFGALDVRGSKALVRLMSEEREQQIGLIDLLRGSLAVVPNPPSVFPSTMAIISDTIVIASGDGKAASLDLSGKVKAERGVQAHLASMIG